MRLVDSSAWIEWLTGTPAGRLLQSKIPPRESCVVPTIVQLSKWLAREKGEQAADSFIAYTSTCVVVPLDTALARRTADISTTCKLATADAIIYATAAHILTCDAHFKGLSRVVYVDKLA